MPLKQEAERRHGMPPCLYFFLKIRRPVPEGVVIFEEKGKGSGGGRFTGKPEPVGERGRGGYDAPVVTEAKTVRVAR